MSATQTETPETKNARGNVRHTPGGDYLWESSEAGDYVRYDDMEQMERQRDEARRELEASQARAERLAQDRISLVERNRILAAELNNAHKEADSLRAEPVNASPFAAFGLYVLRDATQGEWSPDLDWLEQIQDEAVKLGILRLRPALDEDGEKINEWEVSYLQTAPVISLAEHQAKLQAAEQDAEDLAAELQQLTDCVEDLVGESDGVAGLHLNGDMAPWGEISSGGQYERLPDFSDVHAALAVHTARVTPNVRETRN